MYLPTYAAIAHYHGKHGDRSLRDVLDEAEAYAERDYPWALQRGNRLTTDERAAAVAKLASLTGLSEDYVDRVNLRPEHIRFFTELLRDGGRRSAASTAGSPAGTPTTGGSTGPPIRPSTRSWARTARRSITTCAPNWATPMTCPTRC